MMSGSVEALQFFVGFAAGGVVASVLFPLRRRRSAQPAPDPAVVTAVVADAMHALTGILAPVREAAQGEKARLEEAGFPDELAAQMAAQLWVHAVRALPLTMAEGVAASAADWPHETGGDQGSLPPG
jgi:hypothetical protein